MKLKVDKVEDPIGQLYAATGSLVYRRCLQMLRNPDEAMDVTQWTYMRAIETGFEVKSIPQALSWLYLTSTRRCLAHLRDESNRRRIRHQYKGELRGSPSPSPEGSAIGRDLLNRALAHLDERSATLAVLTHLQDMPVHRAAELCGTSVRTVARARRKFEATITALQRGEELP